MQPYSPHSPEDAFRGELRAPITTPKRNIATCSPGTQHPIDRESGSWGAEGCREGCLLLVYYP